MNEAKQKARENRRKKRLVRKVIVWAIVLAGSGFLIFLLVNSSGNGVADANIRPVDETDWVKGNAESAVTLIEYSDFQCPACRTYFPIVKQINEEFGDQIRFVYRHFPLIQVHPNAAFAARAANAAGNQGKFWEMHDILFENQPAWSGSPNVAEMMIGYAAILELDTDKFQEDLSSESAKASVQNSYAEATSAGINSTPTFILDGEKIQNPRGIEEFRTLIQEAIELQDGGQGE